MNDMRIKTRYAESFEVDLPNNNDGEECNNIRNDFLEFCVEKTGANRNEIDRAIVFDDEKNKFIFVVSETIIG